MISLVGRIVEEGHLVGVGSLKQRCPLVEVRPCDRCGVPGRLGVAGFDSPPQLVFGIVQVVEFDAHAQLSGGGSERVVSTLAHSPKSSTTLTPRPRISWARRQSSCSTLRLVDASQGLAWRAQSHSSLVRRTVFRSAASCLASWVFPAPGNPHVSSNRVSLTAPS